MNETPASLDFHCQTCSMRGQSICAALNDKELRSLLEISTAVSLQAGQTIFHEGGADSYVFNVVRGAVRLSKASPHGRRQITGFLFPSDFFGLSVRNVYAYSAEAVTEVSLCRFDRAKLNQLMTRFPKLERQVLNIASTKLIAAQEHLVILGRKSATEKVATFLLAMSERTGTRTQEGRGLCVDLPMSREDIGDYIGLSLETVSRQITYLQNIRLITPLSARKVLVTDRDKLSEVAGEF